MVTRRLQNYEAIEKDIHTGKLSPVHRQGNALCPLPGSWNQREFHSASKVADTIMIYLVRKGTGKHLPVWMNYLSSLKNKTM